ncbi:hypothetical protein CBR_g40356 [Chara braunii]|uniref:Serine hydroxymethyltransferase-like domain-containing protein n=1 Tax=Chara braunii TaxID=69332 RepID=A0A388LTG8_CHABU|nr:hypothetical protein CBR_g40356 [Chara braunii]|eukprot:GBG85628.1 hypothetical protein CBR_g40356 [Chara braunii]
MESAHIAANKNTVPGDVSTMVPGGIRMGTPALTSRGFTEVDFEKVAEFFAKSVQITIKVEEQTGAKLKDFGHAVIAKLRHEVKEYAKQFPTIGFEKGSMKYVD